MFCTKCGAELNEGAEFCSKCGTKAGAAEGQNTTDQQNENRPVTTQVVVMPTGTGPLVMGLLGLFGGFIPIVKYITGLLSLLAIFLGVSQRQKLKGAGLPSGKATAGIVLGSIAVLITVITIAFSAMIIGALFSGGGSSKNFKRINFFTNTLPQGIQGTTWSDGIINIEFGKNKIKLNDVWYSVKKIEKGTGYTNSMLTWIYFDDYCATLRFSNLAGLTGRNGTSVTQGKFKTPAEIEAERRIAKEIVGVWEGSYYDGNTGQNETGMKLTVSEKNGDLTAIFDFFNLPGRSNVKDGATRVSVSYTNGEYLFKFSEWIVHPIGYGSIDLQGRVIGNVSSGYVLSGKTSIGSSFRAEKKD